jgi:glycosidase
MNRSTLRHHPHLYQINIYAWLEHLSEKLGRKVRLADIPDSEWDAIAAMGFDAVWLMGIWQRSPISRKLDQHNTAAFPAYTKALPGWTPDDIIGSPYSILQYEPEGRIGSWKDIDFTREKLHQRKIALFLDFVGNHTALDHAWTHDHPEYYVQGTKENFDRDPNSFHKVESARGTVYIALGRDPYFPAWDDVAQLNHFSPEMRAAQLAELEKIGSHCDGARCDMAMLQLNEIFERIWRPFIGNTKTPAQEFWTDARAAVPDLTLLGEAYWGTEGHLINLGLDFVYDKGLYDAVRDGNIGDIHWRLSAPLEYQSHIGRFLENHDEPRFAAVFGNERFVSAATLMGTLPGLRFYQQGEELGIKLRTPIELCDVADQPTDPVRKEFFAKLFAATRDDAFHDGLWKLLSVTADDTQTANNLFVYEWRTDKAWKVIGVNMSGAPAQGRIHFGGNVSADRRYNFTDQLDGTLYVRDGHELTDLGLFVRREAFEAHIFDVVIA